MIGRTVRVSRPSMRGSPDRIWLRTIFDSSSNMKLRTWFVYVGDASAGMHSASTLAAISFKPLLPRLLLAQSHTLRAARPSAAAVTWSTSAWFLAGGCQSHSGLPPSSTSSSIMSITACCCWWPNTTAPSITSSGNSLASDSTISTAASVPATTRFELRRREFGLGRIEDVLAVDVADARGTDRAVERDAGQRQRGRRADHRRNVGIDLGIDRHHRRDDLHLVVEAIRKQRPDRPIDQPGGQRFLFRRPAFALEKAAGNLAGGVGLFLVVDGQREEVLAGLGFSAGDDGDQHDGIVEADHDGAACLAGDFAGFERQRVAAVRYRFLDGVHVCPLDS